MLFGWEPYSVHCWVDPYRHDWILETYDFSPVVLIDSLIDSYNLFRLSESCSHRNGQGTEEGVDFTTTMAFSRNALKNDVPRKAALDTVIADACWPAARVHEIYPQVSSMCPRCNTEPETDLHTLWTCPCNTNINDIAYFTNIINTINTANIYNSCSIIYSLLLIPSTYLTD